MALAKMLVYPYDLLLLDEPTSGLDPVIRTDVLELIATWAPRDGDRAVVFSSHILEDLEAIADRVVLVRRGRILLDAPVAELQDRQPGRSLARTILERLSHD